MRRSTFFSLLAALSLPLSLACGSDESGDGGSSGSGGSGQGGSGQAGGPPEWMAAVGNEGTLTQTFDEVSWDARQVVEEDLFSVACVGNRLAWAVGENGVVLHSTDAGASFTPLEVPTEEDLYGVRFATAPAGLFLGLVVGERGTLLVSESGGESWRSEAAGGDNALRGVSIANDLSLIMIVGDAGTMIRSTDRGTTFTPSVLTGASDLRSVSIADHASEVLVSDVDGRIWSSKDQAESFELSHQASGAVHSVSLSFDGSWALAAGDADAGVVFRTRDGAWQRATSVPSGAWLAAMVAHDGRSGFVSGEAGRMLQTNDLGQTFIVRDSRTERTLNALENMNGY